MRLMANAKRSITVKRPLPATPGNAFASSGHALSAIVRPMSGTAAAQMYGLQPAEMRLLLCDVGSDLRVGDGVCVDVADTAEPDFRALYVARWSGHVVAHLKLIPEAERGADS